MPPGVPGGGNTCAHHAHTDDGHAVDDDCDDDCDDDDIGDRDRRFPSQ